MSRILALVVGNEAIMPATHVLRLRAGPAAGQAAPGQFLHIRCGESQDPLLRRAISVAGTGDDVLRIVVHVVGRGSAWLAARRVGDELDCLGPQGKGFRLDTRSRHLLMVGDESGVGPLVGLAQRAVGQGSSVTLAVGAATAARVLPAGLLPEQVEYLVATDDGSLGHRGSVIELAEGWLTWADAIYAAGSVSITSALAAQLRLRVPRKPSQVLIEAPMACSVGACLSCLVMAGRGQLRACIDGPVFDLHQIAWDQMSVEPQALIRSVSE